MSYNTWKILYLWYKCFKGIRAFPALVSSQVLSVKKLFLKLFGIGVNSRGRVCSFTLQNRFLYTKWYLTIKKIISSHITSITHVRIRGKIIFQREEQWTKTYLIKQQPQWIPKFIKFEKKISFRSRFKQYKKGGNERKWFSWTKLKRWKVKNMGRGKLHGDVAKVARWRCNHGWRRWRQTHDDQRRWLQWQGATPMATMARSGATEVMREEWRWFGREGVWFWREKFLKKIEMCTTEGWWGWWGRFWRIKDFCEGEKVLWTDLECSLFSVEGSGTLINIINWWGRIWNVDNFFLQKNYYQFFFTVTRIVHCKFGSHWWSFAHNISTTFFFLFLSSLNLFYSI